MTRDQFDHLVSQAVDALPPEFLDRLDNVSITIQAWPTQQQLTQAKVPSGGTLFGLYQGVPQTKRSAGGLMPDKITIFAGPILAVSHSPQEVQAQVSRVVRHEIAHHFGMDEPAIRHTGH